MSRILFVFLFCFFSISFAESLFPLESYQTLVDSMVPESKLGLSIRSLKTGKELAKDRTKEVCYIFPSLRLH